MEIAALSELDPRALGLVLSSVTPLVIANEVFEMGGELESYLKA